LRESPVGLGCLGATAAIAPGQREQKPVFLFVGSFTSELSGSMRRQSFANAKTADWLNKNFVCVVVDRDERPDVGALFQAYVSTLKQMTGWPLNIWLTPEFKPLRGRHVPLTVRGLGRPGLS